MRSYSLILPMNHLGHYVYAMYVLIRPLSERHRWSHSFRFQRHYGKYDNEVQVLLTSPRIPYLHGFTVPTPAADPETNALFQLSMCVPAACRGDCKDICSIGSQWLFPDVRHKHRCRAQWRLRWAQIETHRQRAQHKVDETVTLQPVGTHACDYTRILSVVREGMCNVNKRVP